MCALCLSCSSWKAHPHCYFLKRSAAITDLAPALAAPLWHNTILISRNAVPSADMFFTFFRPVFFLIFWDILRNRHTEGKTNRYAIDFPLVVTVHLCATRHWTDSLRFHQDTIARNHHISTHSPPTFHILPSKKQKKKTAHNHLSCDIKRHDHPPLPLR